MKNNRANRHNDRGFTLSEVLLTVAILVVLFALAAGSRLEDAARAAPDGAGQQGGDLIPDRAEPHDSSFWPPVWRRNTRTAAT